METVIQEHVIVWTEIRPKDWRQSLDRNSHRPLFKSRQKGVLKLDRRALIKRQLFDDYTREERSDWSLFVGLLWVFIVLHERARTETVGSQWKKQKFALLRKNSASNRKLPLICLRGIWGVAKMSRSYDGQVPAEGWDKLNVCRENKLPKWPWHLPLMHITGHSLFIARLIRYACTATNRLIQSNQTPKQKQAFLEHPILNDGHFLDNFWMFFVRKTYALFGRMLRNPPSGLESSGACCTETKVRHATGKL